MKPVLLNVICPHCENNRQYEILAKKEGITDVTTSCVNCGKPINILLLVFDVKKSEKPNTHEIISEWR